MGLQALVLCSDDKIIRVLRRVLGDLEITVEECADAGSAVRKLTRQRYEAVIVDCNNEDMAAQVLRSVRAAPRNKHAIAVAVIDSAKAVRSAFDLGAHFVLYKPISLERTKSSFRAARALMKCERRRNTRVAVEIPVTLAIGSGQDKLKTATSDLSEGGMAVRFPRRAHNSGSLRINFTLPGTEHVVECSGAVAWENDSAQAGIRFVDLSPEHRGHLKAWLAKHSPEIEQDDPPVACKLTDLSLGGCYVEMTAPFPVRTKVVLAMQIAALRVEVEGVVRVMHQEIGMGLEFTRTSDQQRQQVEKFIQALMSNNGVLPELEVRPEGLEDANLPVPEQKANNDVEDPLLGLFLRKTELTTESFLNELRKQRGSHPDAAAAAVPM